MQQKTVAIYSGDISTHVIGKLGLQSVAESPVTVYFNPNMDAGPFDSSWSLINKTQLSENGGHDTLVTPETIQRGLYMMDFDFSNVDHAARQIYKKEDINGFIPLNPTGFFLATRTCITLKIADPNTYNHLVISVGSKEITIRPGVRKH